MPARRPLLTLLCLAAAACSQPTPSSPSPPPTPLPPPPVVSASAVASSAPPPAFACTPVAPLAAKTPPAVTPDGSKEVKNTCERLERASARVADKRKAKNKEYQELRKHTLEGLGRCFRGPRGAWIFEVRTAGKGKGESFRPVAPDEETFAFDWELVHVDPAGKEVRGDVRGTALRFGSLSETIAIDGAHDLDGDGVAELIFNRLYSNTDEEHSENRSVIRAKGGKIEPYPHTDKEIIRELKDVDGDGRMDLILQSPFHVEGPCGLDGQQFYGPAVLAHTLPDGTFSRDDAVARAFVREQCAGDPTRPLLVFSSPGTPDQWLDGDASVWNIACASFWGLSPELLQSRIQREFTAGEKPDGAGDCVPLKMLQTLPEKAPPFLLDDCPAR